MKYPAHDKERFFKYVSPETAIKILETSTVRYSSPLRFNDPFDVQSGLHLDFNLNLLRDGLFQRLERLVAAETQPVFANPDAPGAQAASRMWDMKATHGFPAERAKEVLAPAFALVESNLANMCSLYQRHIWEDLVPRLRVFSVSEERDNLLMWAHYAKEHTGAVLELRVLPSDDNPLCAAARVNYYHTPAPLFSEQQFIGHWFGTEPWDKTQIMLSRYALAKGEAWSYEKEWRVWYPVDGQHSQLYEYVPLSPKELGGVYLGCRLVPKDRDKILARVAERYPDARVFQARKATAAYGLEYDAI